jgi:two-component system KDP operon response regulator KdpE
VLVVEDEPHVMLFLRATLPSHGYRVVEAATGAQAVIEASTRAPDLVLLDLGLPDMDGVDVTRRLREWSYVPIIVISARGQEADKVQALDAGADDYLTKPFGVEELLARVRVALRHAARAAAGAGSPTFEVADLRVDLATRRVSVGGRDVHLTRTEYQLLATLVRHAGTVVTHRQILREVWGSASGHETHTVRVHMAALRRKIEADPARPKVLLTEQGVGYRLVVD